MPELLVLYYSRNGATRRLAQHIAQGIESVPGAIARVRSVRNGTARMQWFYRPCDIPPSALLGAPEPAPNELFASDRFDDNPIETILAPCAVSTAPTGPNVYFSRRRFTGARIRGGPW